MKVEDVVPAGGDGTAVTAAQVFVGQTDLGRAQALLVVLAVLPADDGPDGQQERLGGEVGLGNGQGETLAKRHFAEAAVRTTNGTRAKDPSCGSHRG